MCDSRRARHISLVQPKLVFFLLSVTLGAISLIAQSNHAISLLAGGDWQLHSRVPLGTDAVLLQPAGTVAHILASAEVPEFEGWSLRAPNNKPMLLNAAGKPVEALPTAITFRVSVGTRSKIADSQPMPLEWKQTLNDFLLGMRFHVQIFRGMEMRQIEPTKTWMIGVPADEPSNERIYRASFKMGELKPDDRIVLLVTTPDGTRLSKFHLEFL